MIHRMGNDNGGVDGSDVLLWVLGGTAATVILYNLLKRPSVVPEGLVFSKEQSFPDMNSVAVRFGQIRELWSMGYLDSTEAVSQLEGLSAAILELQKAGKASAASAQELVTRIERMVKDIVDYQAAA